MPQIVRGGNPEEVKKGTQMGSSINQGPGSHNQTHQIQFSPIFILTAACRNEMKKMWFNSIYFDAHTPVKMRISWNWIWILMDPVTCHNNKTPKWHVISESPNGVKTCTYTSRRPSLWWIQWHVTEIWPQMQILRILASTTAAAAILTFLSFEMGRILALSRQGRTDFFELWNGANSSTFETGSLWLFWALKWGEF